MEDLFAAEGQKLACQTRCAKADRPDFGDDLAVRIILSELPEQQIAVPVDHGQQVVEVMGNAAGKPADAFQFLCLQQLFLQAWLFPPPPASVR